MFSKELLALIHRALGDAAAYDALLGSLGKLARIIKDARRLGCNAFRCTLRRDLRIELYFKGPDGHAMRRTLSFKRAYERSGKVYGFETALLLRLAVESLVVVAGGIRLMT